ncbi:phosphoglycolate phosphatase-like HAD superfamily hydrolase [Streptomyces sp. 846.5]|nr:HAD family hydrolase [Streptomyces sp. 846.5]TDU06345.1 phosphoglycolate phosphatase-like HAD superfamily hydrolase [Streptomyces sp. 846.5]
MRAHIVWDWNGTLFDDVEVVVEASNAAFAAIDLAPLTVQQYREQYQVPVIGFYEQVMGRTPTAEEWLVMDARFHRHYETLRDSCGLTEGADDVLAGWSGSQSLLSMYAHDDLLPLVRRLGVDRHFIRVDGRTSTSGVSGKAEHLVRHLAAIQVEGVHPSRTVLIGDVVDDALAAAHVGAQAVLFTGGSHARSELERVGVPVADTLAQAVEYAQDLVKS